MNHPSSIINNQSGEDLDVWGGQDTQVSVIPIPGGAEPCPLKVDGECPDGCEACVDFARSMETVGANRGSE